MSTQIQVLENKGEVKPEFVRLPKAGCLCSVTGFSRTTVSELIDSGQVKAKKYRPLGSLRHIVLVDYNSLVEFARSLPDKKPKNITSADQEESQ